jgi:hypothetical protein
MISYCPDTPDARARRPGTGGSYADAASAWSSIRPRAQVEGREQLGDRLDGPGAGPGDVAVRPDEHSASVGEAVASGQQGGVADQFAACAEHLQRHGRGRRGGPPGVRVGSDDQREAAVEQVQQRVPASTGRHPGVRRALPGEHTAAVRPGGRDHGGGVSLLEVVNPGVSNHPARSTSAGACGQAGRAPAPARSPGPRNSSTVVATRPSSHGHSTRAVPPALRCKGPSASARLTGVGAALRPGCPVAVSPAPPVLTLQRGLPIPAPHSVGGPDVAA